MEWEWEAYRTFVDPALQILEQLHDKLNPPHLNNPIQTVLLDLRFFKMILWGLAYWEESEHDWHLLSVMSNLGLKLRQAAKEFTVQCECADDMDNITNWEQRSYHLETRIQQYKPQAKEICIFLLDGEFKCKSCQHGELFLENGRKTASFIDFILENLEPLNLKSNLIAPVKQQMGFIQGKLVLFRNFACLVNYWSTTRAQSLGELIAHTRTWANHIASLACLYWIDEMDESLASITGTMLSDLMHKTMPYTPNVVKWYLDVLLVTRYHKFEGTMIPQLLLSYVDFLLEDSVIPIKDDIEILRGGLIFLLSFVVDPPTKDSDDTELIWAQIHAIINQVPSIIFSIHSDRMIDGTFENVFSDFLKEISRVKAKIRELYVRTAHSSLFNSPSTNAMGFLDSFLGKLNVNFNPVHMHQVEIVQEELALLRPFLQNIMEPQNRHGQIKDLWTQIINLVYNAGYVIKLSLVRDVPIWESIICLSVIIEEIKDIKIEVKEIENQWMYKKHSP